MQKNKYKRRQKEQSPDSLEDAYSPQRLPAALKNDEDYLNRISASGEGSAQTHKIGIVGQVPGRRDGADG